MKDSFQIEHQFDVPAARIYFCWLNSDEHTAMTGGDAHCSDGKGDKFSAWDGYITGSNQELEEDKKIVQSWRTTEFASNDEDSLLEIELVDIPSGCLLKMKHSNIPEGQGNSYKQGWTDHYFDPMEDYFSS